VAIIHGAAKTGDIRAVRSSLERGTDANEVDRHGRPPLVLAAQRGHGPVVELLLDHGADAATDGQRLSPNCKMQEPLNKP
jgi:ankyrin repeat protein